MLSVSIVVLGILLNGFDSYAYVSRLHIAQTVIRPASVLHDDRKTKHTTMHTSSSHLYLSGQSMSPTSVRTRPKPTLRSFFKTYWLVLGEFCVILAAKKNPYFGRTGGILRPEITINKIAVAFIFFINGLFLSPNSAPEQRDAGNKFNILIQLFNFGFIPLFTRIVAPFYPYKELSDGLMVLACLPTTMSICISQTQAAGGDMTTAIFNAIFANTLGVFLTPLLTVWMIGAGQGTSLIHTLKKLGTIVILPMIVGQMLRYTPVLPFAERFRKYTRECSSILLLSIVYTTFCDTFIKGFGIPRSALIGLLCTMPIANIFFMLVFWNISKKIVPGIDVKTRAAGLFCATQKTLAFGIPFIKTALGHRPDVSSILAPLLLYAPTQLILGSSLIVPLMIKKIEDDEKFEGGGGI
mmetsp:Transcript_5252/g.5384  ORF Transcript_5252/g.5384 Transcript_5252/m.5384 type:complete len:410 (+) Transcript_5252:82-1311(+)